MLALLVLGIIDKEEYYNLQTQNWGFIKLMRWLANGKPQSWFKWD